MLFCDRFWWSTSLYITPAMWLQCPSTLTTQMHIAARREPPGQHVVDYLVFIDDNTSALTSTTLLSSSCSVDKHPFHISIFGKRGSICLISSGQLLYGTSYVYVDTVCPRDDGKDDNFCSSGVDVDPLVASLQWPGVLQLEKSDFHKLF